jgi:hypothetical protein
MAHIQSVAEFSLANEWYEIINTSSLLLPDHDLSGCLFGVDNYAGFVPLFPDRGLPDDLSITVSERLGTSIDEEAHASWATCTELQAIDWSELAAERDLRTSEFVQDENGNERFVTKWLNEPDMSWVQETLAQDPDSEVRFGRRIFRRPFMRRADAIRDTDFPLVMKLMECLAERFGGDKVRIVVWFV